MLLLLLLLLLREEVEEKREVWGRRVKRKVKSSVDIRGER